MVFILKRKWKNFLLELANDRPVVAVAERVPNNLLIGSDEYVDRYDPHLWMDPRIWSYIVLNVRDALIEILPDAKTRI